MKIKLLFVALCACCLFSCGDDELDNGGQLGPLASFAFSADQNIAPSVSKAENEVGITFSSSMAWTATISSDATEWCLLSEDEIMGDAGEEFVVSATLLANTTDSRRVATITFQSGSVKKSINIAQASGKLVASIDFAEGQDVAPSVPNTENEVSITFSSSMAWTTSVDATSAWWCMLSSTSQAGEAGEDIVITATITPNPFQTSRVATITFESDDLTKTIVITQAAADPTPVEKLTIVRGESSSFHDAPIGSEGPIENAFDGILTGDAIYHSDWAGGVTEMVPIVNEFFFASEGVNVNKLIITQRDGRNGLLKTFNVYVRTADTPANSYGEKVGTAVDLPANNATYTLEFDTKSNVTSVVLVHTSGHGDGGGYVAYQEVEFFG